MRLDELTDLSEPHFLLGKLGDVNSKVIEVFTQKNVGGQACIDPKALVLHRCIDGGLNVVRDAGSSHFY